MSTQEAVQKHYDNSRLLETIFSGLRTLGRDPDRLSPDDLAAVDEFHIRGRDATEETARMAGFDEGSHVLDIGSGIGGPSRLLATAFGLRVTGVDLCASYCEVATELAARCGLAERVDYRQGDATRLPFEDGSFDGAWTQHASMNIEDKAALYREMARVVKPGGRVAIYDIHGVGDQPPHFPVPWARGPEISFLCSAKELRGHLEGQGLEPVAWHDDTGRAHAWFADLIAQAARSGPRPLGLHVLMGPDWPAMAKNVERNLQEGRIGVLQTVWTKA